MSFLPARSESSGVKSEMSLSAARRDTNPKRERGFRQRSPRSRFGLVWPIGYPSENRPIEKPPLPAHGRQSMIGNTRRLNCALFLRTEDRGEHKSPFTVES